MAQTPDAPLTLADTGQENIASNSTLKGAVKQPVHPRDLYPSTAWTGLGPLAGLILDGSFLKGDFVDGGDKWLPVLDDYGNAWVVDLTPDIYNSSKFSDWMHVRQQVHAHALFRATCEQAMRAQGIGIGVAPQGQSVDKQNPDPNNDYRSRELGTWGFPMYIQQGSGVLRRDLSNSTYAWWYGRGGFDPGDLSHPSFGELEMSPGGNDNDPTQGPNNPEAHFNPYVYYVPATLPVPQEHQADWDGRVFLEVNLWTRHAVVIDTISRESIWSAIWKTILAVVQIIVGALITAGSLGTAAVGGVAMIVSGVSTAITTWYTFDQVQKNQQAAVMATFNPARLGAAGAKILGDLAAGQKNTAPSGQTPDNNAPAPAGPPAEPPAASPRGLIPVLITASLVVGVAVLVK